MYKNSQLLSSINSRFFDSFGEALSFAIDRRGKKRSVVAKEADNMDEGQLSKYLSGERTPRPPNQQLLTKVVGVQVIKDRGKWKLIDPRDDIATEEQGSDPARSQDLEKARNSVAGVERLVSDYTKSGLREDDPQKLLAHAEMLIRIARELMKKGDQ